MREIVYEHHQSDIFRNLIKLLFVSFLFKFLTLLYGVWLEFYPSLENFRAKNPHIWAVDTRTRVTPPRDLRLHWFLMLIIANVAYSFLQYKSTILFRFQIGCSYWMIATFSLWYVAVDFHFQITSKKVCWKIKASLLLPESLKTQPNDQKLLVKNSRFVLQAMLECFATSQNVWLLGTWHVRDMKFDCQTICFLEELSEIDI